MGMPKQTEENFWSKIDQRGNGCWEWDGQFSRDGYGKVSWGGKTYRAHRIAAWLGGLMESPQSSKQVLHKCDNPKCCRLDHLFLGTTQENTKDRDNKSRQVKGTRVHLSKVNEEIVRKIRGRYAYRKTTLQKLGKEFGLSISAIYSIISRETWKHVE